MINRNITLLNLHAALERFSHKTLDVFGGVYFLSNGVPFHAVALMWTASFLIRLGLRPLSVWLSSKIGLKRALILGIIASSGLFLIFNFVDGINIWLFIFALYLAFYDILYWLPYHAYYAASGEENNRGKQVAYGASLVSIVQIVMPIAGATLAAKFGFDWLYISAMVCMLLSVIPVFFMEEKGPGQAMSFRQARKEIDKRGFAMAVGDGILENGHRFLWTIVLFSLAGSLINFGWLITVELAMVATLSVVVGNFIDSRNARWIGVLGIVIMAFAIASRGSWVETIPQIIFINLVAAFGGIFYSMVYMVNIYNFAKRTPNTLWFHFFAEAGWDVGGVIAMLVSAGLFALGVSLQHIILFSLLGLIIINHVFRSYHASSTQSSQNATLPTYEQK